MHLQHLIAIAGISGLASSAVVPSGLETRGDDPGFVYEQAYRIRIAKNAEFPDFTDRDYDRILPGLPDSDSQLSTWWFGYQSAGTRFTNIAVAQLWPSAVYYEQVYHSEFSSTWKAYTDHEKFFRLSFKAQGLTEFDPDYPQEHNVFVNRDDTDLALGAPAPTHPPEIWGPAPGTYLVCRREFQRREVLAVRFAYSVLNETQTGNIPRACVPVKLESRCAQLEPLLFNKTWNHDEIITTPCVKDAFSWGKKAVRGPAPVALDYTQPAAMARELHRETKQN